MKNYLACLAGMVILPISASATATFVDLGSAHAFAVLAGSTDTITGATLIEGDLGVSPGTSITGLLPGVLVGTVHAGDAVAAQAESDLTAAYNFAASEACDASLQGQDLGGLTLTPGVYCFASSAQLTGILTLDSLGDPNAVFVFQIGSTLTTASNSSVMMTNSGQPDDIFWQVGSSAILGTGTVFQGHIMALSSITLTTGAEITCGSALARNGAVTMDSNHISITSPGCGGAAAVPEPGTGSLLLMAGACVMLLKRRFDRNALKVATILRSPRP